MAVSAEDTQARSLWFGWFAFRPKCLQFLNSAKWFLFFVCMYFFTQSIVVNGVYSVSITTIEKRYGYSSSMTGLLTSCYDIAAFLITPLVSYLGARRRKPKWCGVGLLVMGTGFFIFILPHLFSGKYDAGKSSSDRSLFCDVNRTIDSTSPQCRQSQSNGAYFMLFVIGMLVTGAGSTPMWNLGTAFIDENVKSKSSPMYIGIFSCSGVIGAGVGFVLGGFFLSMYVDVGTPTSLTPKSEDWVGAWWLGFTVSTGFAVLWSGWLMGFPKEFPTTRELKKQNLVGNNNATDQEVGYVKLRDLPKASKSLLSKIPYVAATLAVCIEGFLVSAFTAFMPKVIEQQFQYPPSLVSLLMGVVVIPAALLGTFLGAYICKRFRLHLRGAAKMSYMVSALSLLATCLLFLNCDTPSIAGINGSYANESSLQLTSSCNTRCACSALEFKPVCSNGMTYFSPCFAGCQTEFKNGSWSDCACLTSSGSHVISGICTTDCGLKPIFYLIAYFMVVFLTFLSATPATIITLRCVSNDQRAYALGIQSSLLRILGTIPGPIIVGTLIDMTCTLWNKGCNGRENCLQYDNRSLSMVVLVTGLIAKIIITTCYFIACVFSPKDQVDENGDASKRKEIAFRCGSIGDCDRETKL